MTSISLPGMDLAHPIDAEIRAWLSKHVENESELSLAVGRSKTWLHKYVNGSGHATIDDLVRLAGLLMGLNLPALTELQRTLLRACLDLDEATLADVTAYAKLRAKLAQRAPSKESSAPGAHSLPATARKGRGKR